MIINLTPHVVRLNDGREFPPSGAVARVATHYITAPSIVAQNGPEHDIPVQTAFFSPDDITGIPPSAIGTYYIVSALVADKAQRDDLLVPATGHPDVRREAGQVVSVPFFLCLAHSRYERETRIGWGGENAIHAIRAVTEHEALILAAREHPGALIYRRVVAGQIGESDDGRRSAHPGRLEWREIEAGGAK